MGGNLPADATSKMKHAAELRTQGKSWEQIALTVGWSVEQLTDWRCKHRRQWGALFRQARRQWIDETLFEVILVLRHQLRSSDEKVINQAAFRLIQALIPLQKTMRISGSSPSKTPESSSRQQILLDLLRTFADEDKENAAELFALSTSETDETAG